jgi:hypothetical protein
MKDNHKKPLMKKEFRNKMIFKFEPLEMGVIYLKDEKKRAYMIELSKIIFINDA